MGAAFAGFLELLKLLPAIIAGVKALIGMASAIKERVDKREDERNIEDEKNAAHNGRRPSNN